MTTDAPFLAPARRARSDWDVVERAGSPLQLHQACASPGSRQIVITWPTSGAVVLGSTQAASDFDADRCAGAGLEVVRRRSGGGGVLVQPGSQLWVDFYIPVTDPLFSPDVSRSFVWLGELWATAIREATGSSVPAAVATPGDCRAGRMARRLCFCGITRGEVTIRERKVVGLCQRRDRAGAWFHTMALTHLDVALTSSLVAGSGEVRLEAAGVLESTATALPAGTTGDSVLEALLRALSGLAQVSD